MTIKHEQELLKNHMKFTKVIEPKAEFHSYNLNNPKTLVVKQLFKYYGNEKSWYVQIYDDQGNHEEIMQESLIRELFN